MSPRWKVSYVLWPRRLAVKNDDGMKFVGWVWLQKAYLTNNLNHGWVAFLDNQTEEYLSKCPCCNRLFKEEK